MANEESILLKQFKPVTIQDDAMFGAVMEDSEYCKPFLETILGMKIKKIEYPKKQKVIDLSVNAKSIRMDVYVEDGEGTVYDVEMQTGKKRNLPKRARFYHGLIDLNILAKGEDYNKLKKSMVLFVCTFDPFGRDKYIYRYANRDEDTYELLEDDAWTIFVNAKGHRGNVSDEFKSLMRYIMDGQAEDSYTQALEKKVELINSDKKWQVEYMTLAIKLADERYVGREEGREEGRMLELIEKICRKITKGKDIATIADELEEDENLIRKIVSVASEYAPEYDSEKIYQAIS